MSDDPFTAAPPAFALDDETLLELQAEAIDIDSEAEALECSLAAMAEVNVR
jgi:hypothetical protein